MPLSDQSGTRGAENRRHRCPASRASAVRDYFTEDFRAWLRAHPGAQAWLYECHPELSFRAIAEGRVLESKKTAHGQADRLRLIENEFPDVLAATAAIRLEEDDAQLMDVLDAYAALESALHVAAGDYEELGGETDSLGLIMRMVF